MFFFLFLFYHETSVSFEDQYSIFDDFSKNEKHGDNFSFRMPLGKLASLEQGYHIP